MLSIPGINAGAFRTIPVKTIFTPPCFMRSSKDGEVYDKQLVYTGDDCEVRLFDVHGYELLKRLPEIVQSLLTKKPHHNRNRRNFFAVEVIAGDGQTVEYEIYFKVKKIGKAGWK